MLGAHDPREPRVARSRRAPGSRHRLGGSSIPTAVAEDEGAVRAKKAARLIV